MMNESNKLQEDTNSIEGVVHSNRRTKCQSIPAPIRIFAYIFISIMIIMVIILLFIKD